MPCPNLIYICTCARMHVRTYTWSIAISTYKRTQMHARKRTRTQINARKLIVAFDAWAISACKRICVLRVRSKTFRMYYKLRIFLIKLSHSSSTYENTFAFQHFSDRRRAITFGLKERAILFVYSVRTVLGT